MSDVELARRLLGVPWAHQGRSVHGVDCIGLVVLVEIAKGRTVPDRVDYLARAHDDTLERELAAYYGPPVIVGVPALDDLREGDRIVFRIGRDQQRHIGIVSRPPYGGWGVVHAYDGGPKAVAEMRLDDKWRRRIVAVYR